MSVSTGVKLEAVSQGMLGDLLGCGGSGLSSTRMEADLRRAHERPLLLRSATVDLNRDVARPGTVELSQDYALPTPAHEPSFVDLQPCGTPQQESSQMRRSVAAFAVGASWVVVRPRSVVGNEPLEKSAVVVAQRLLPFIDEHCSGRVERLDRDRALEHAALSDESFESLGEVKELEPIVRFDCEYASKGGLRGGH